MRPLFLIAALGAAGLAVAAANDLFNQYEEPKYKTELEEGNFELRAYPSVIAASVQVAGSGEAAANNAFRILAGYIFGKNRGTRKIAMTTPVLQETSSEKIAMTVPVTVEMLKTSMTMSFYMPSKYSLHDLPEALDKRIKFARVPSRKFAALRFSGFGNERDCQLKEEELRRWMRDHGLQPVGEPVRAFYNPPWTLPFLRRNEIWIAF